MRKRWVIQKHDHGAAGALAAKLGVSPLIGALLIARGHDTEEKARTFLNPDLCHLHEPFLLKDLEIAAERVQRAIEGGEKILIWGDYDVDGTTGTTLLRRAIKILGGETSFHIPDRFTEGYGVNIPALEQAVLAGISLVITVDCGIRSFEPLAWAKEKGVDVIVTDHHLSDEVRGNPPAFAVVNPNQPGCPYPDKDLAGVGVAFKLAHALLRKNQREHLVPAFLKVAAIGTVADVMQLAGENRAIVALGLRDLPRTSNYGLKALMEVADCRAEMTSYHIGYRIGPRINAAGRMDLARQVVELFETESFEEARRLAAALDDRNRERQRIQQEITERALSAANDLAESRFIVVAGEGWHRGVIGLAASRLAERLQRPTIVLSTQNGLAHGSARTVRDLHLLKALESCGDVFEQFGGHAAAAGLTMRTENIGRLRTLLNQYCEAIEPDPEEFPELAIDAHVSSRSMTLALVEELSVFEPFGAGNPKPVFVTKGLVMRDEPLVMKEKHLKFWLEDDDRKRFEAVWWDGVDRSAGQTLAPGNRIEVAYTPEANVWQGNTRLQLVVHDMRADNQ